MGALLVFSVSSRSSFKNCETWLDELMLHADPGIIIMLVGNKTDLIDQRDVSTEEGKEFALKNKLHFVETSAKDNSNVQEAFERLIKEICKQHVLSRDFGHNDTDEQPPVSPSKAGVVTVKNDTPKEEGCTC
eukprot:TRINITY_DN310_c0_g1_i1.p1 TRINITY_DN310_c0_g1~~TRINITY_DN310_c0_g1_i1.p1  ORF type:complete len:132 (-),score=23.25 TRINITY_DN310_c0_g1_i1:152-547(-)